MILKLESGLDPRFDSGTHSLKQGFPILWIKISLSKEMDLSITEVFYYYSSFYYYSFYHLV